MRDVALLQYHHGVLEVPVPEDNDCIAYNVIPTTVTTNMPDATTKTTAAAATQFNCGADNT